MRKPKDISHDELRCRATKILRERGYGVPEKEHSVGPDVVGKRGDEKVAVECGYVTKLKLLSLLLEFDQIYHCPYPSQKPIQLDYKSIKEFLENQLNVHALNLATVVEKINKIFKPSRKIVITFHPKGLFEIRTEPEGVKNEGMGDGEAK